MATTNPFDLLGEIDNDDPSQLIIAAQQQQLKAAPKKTLPPAQAAAAQKQTPVPGKMPSKPLPPAQAGKKKNFFFSPYNFSMNCIFPASCVCFP